jgi:glycosyltransferase involved in cell wall biosynthesis
MKLIIQIPAFNEEATIAQTLRDLPKKLDGISSIETLVIDDGSSDRTADAARKAGANHILELKTHRGLAAAFIAGVDAALRLGADVIVNTDADNQYVGADVAKLVAPIVNGTAEVVVGDREVAKSPYMSGFKRMLQRLGSWTVGLASGVNVSDVTSGFRAFSRDAAIQLNVFNPFTYTLETIIQSGNRNLGVQTVAVRTNAPTRPSRLYRGIGTYLRKSVVTIFRVYALYRPLKTFFAIGSILTLAGVILGARFLYYFIQGDRGGHIQSLILAAVFLITGFHTWLIGLLADLTAVNRRLSEEMLIRMKRLEMPATAKPRRDRDERRDRPERNERPPRPAVAERAARPERAERPARPERPERPDRRPKPETQEAAPAAAPATQWVWLLDEDKLQDRIGGEQKAEKAEVKPEKTEPRPERKELPPAPAIDVDDDEFDDDDEPLEAGDEVVVEASGDKGPVRPGRRRRRRRGGPRKSTDLPGNRGKHIGDGE